MCRRVTVAVILSAAIACSGPAPPEKELHQAEGAIAAARAADAAIYAPEELKTAESALLRYDGAVAEGDYRQALHLAFEARDTAYEAVRRAADQKAVSRGRAERLIADLTALLDQAAERQSGTTALRAPAAAARLRAAAVSASAHLQEARSQLQKQDYHAVSDALGPVLEHLRTELGGPPMAAPRRER